MNCPQCQNKYVCPCKSCIERNPHVVPWIWTRIDDGHWMESCSKCGLTKSADDWMDIEYEQYNYLAKEER